MLLYSFHSSKILKTRVMIDLLKSNSRYIIRIINANLTLITFISFLQLNPFHFKCIVEN